MEPRVESSGHRAVGRRNGQTNLADEPSRDESGRRIRTPCTVWLPRALLQNALLQDAPHRTTPYRLLPIGCCLQAALLLLSARCRGLCVGLGHHTRCPWVHAPGARAPTRLLRTAPRHPRIACVQPLHSAPAAARTHSHLVTHLRTPCASVTVLISVLSQILDGT